MANKRKYKKNLFSRISTWLKSNNGIRVTIITIILAILSVISSIITNLVETSQNSEYLKILSYKQKIVDIDTEFKLISHEDPTSINIFTDDKALCGHYIYFGNTGGVDATIVSYKAIVKIGPSHNKIEINSLTGEAYLFYDELPEYINNIKIYTVDGNNTWISQIIDSEDYLKMPIVVPAHSSLPIKITNSFKLNENITCDTFNNVLMDKNDEYFSEKDPFMGFDELKPYTITYYFTTLNGKTIKSKSMSCFDETTMLTGINCDHLYSDYMITP